MKPTFSLRGSWVHLARRPMVYVWRRGSAALYVGLGTRGLARPLGTHHALTEDAVLPTDKVDVYVCSTPLEAMDLEMELIHALKPTLNRARPSPISLTRSVERAQGARNDGAAMGGFAAPRSRTAGADADDALAAGAVRVPSAAAGSA